MTTEKEQLEAEIAKCDARLEKLEAIVPIESNLRATAERVAAELDRELAALKAQKPISDMEIEAEGWWNDDHNVYTWPITVGEWGARIECHGRTPAEAQQLALSVVKAQPSAGVVDEREAFEAGVKAASDHVKAIVDDYDRRQGSTDPDTGTREYPGNGEEWVSQMLELIEDFTGIVAPAGLQSRARLNSCRAQAVPEGYVLVPVEPTLEMMKASKRELEKSPVIWCRYKAAYRALLAAAPSAQQKESGDE